MILLLIVRGGRIIVIVIEYRSRIEGKFGKGRKSVDQVPFSFCFAGIPLVPPLWAAPGTRKYPRPEYWRTCPRSTSSHRRNQDVFVLESFPADSLRRALPLHRWVDYIVWAVTRETGSRVIWETKLSVFRNLWWNLRSIDLIVWYLYYILIFFNRLFFPTDIFKLLFVPISTITRFYIENNRGEKNLANWINCFGSFNSILSMIKCYYLSKNGWREKPPFLC